MKKHEELSNRQVNILFAIVKEYVDNSQSLGSKELQEKYGFNFSPATIRSEVSVLREKEYLYQPFTNSSSKPTEKSYKLFVSKLMEGLEVTNHQQQRLKGKIIELQDKQAMMSKEIANLLAVETKGIAFSLTNDHEEIKGLTNILKSPDEGKVSDLLLFLDNLDTYKKHLLPGSVDELLEASEDTRESKDNLKMIIGDDNPVVPLGKGYAMVSTEVELDNGEKSVVGLISPVHLLAKKKNLELLKALNRVLCSDDNAQEPTSKAAKN